MGETKGKQEPKVCVKWSINQINETEDILPIKPNPQRTKGG